ncbi:hypothetical protein GEV43_07045 [Actinomadura sp. J1-007]|uniref:hypothetical protein n=1 Tax=Actinomadura sp. J1-007 TaxID=2661913 RepID=UPI001324D854|nr:hypothetical protein [Actinomadura sp. J1-007]MWK33822.1 hypothetical protein [Actinomadura sp. J1-007]
MAQVVEPPFEQRHPRVPFGQGVGEPVNGLVGDVLAVSPQGLREPQQRGVGAGDRVPERQRRMVGLRLGQFAAPAHGEGHDGAQHGHPGQDEHHNHDQAPICPRLRTAAPARRGVSAGRSCHDRGRAFAPAGPPPP